jgi:hypothetical protein
MEKEGGERGACTIFTTLIPVSSWRRREVWERDMGCVPSRRREISGAKLRKGGEC